MTCRRRQRGGLLLDLLLYASVVTIAGAVFYGSVSFVKNKVNAWADATYVEPVRAQMNADLKACRAETAEVYAQRTQVEAANTTLKRDIDDARIRIEANNQTIDDLNKAVARARAARAPEDAAAKSRNAELARQNFDLLAALSAPDPGGKCEDRMARIDANLRKLGADSLRFNPPAAAATAAPGNSGGAGEAAPGKGSNTDALRIR